MKYIPLGDRVIVRPLTEAEAAEKNPFGIYIPDSAQLETQAIVVAVGPGVYDSSAEKYIPSDLEVGDRVVHGNLGTWKESIKYDDMDCYILNTTNVLAYAERS